MQLNLLKDIGSRQKGHENSGRCVAWETAKLRKYLIQSLQNLQFTIKKRELHIIGAKKMTESSASL